MRRASRAGHEAQMPERAGFFAPAGFLVPHFEGWLATHFSSLGMNIRYRRAVTPETLRAIRVQSAGILALWAVLCTLAALHRLPGRFFTLWYIVSACISLRSRARALYGANCRNPSVSGSGGLFWNNCTPANGVPRKSFGF